MYVLLLPLSYGNVIDVDPFSSVIDVLQASWGLFVVNVDQVSPQIGCVEEYDEH